MSRFAAVFAFAVGLWASLSALAVAQGGRNIWEGIYTQEQAARGKKAYVENCSNCHQEGLQGADLAPPLKGDEFLLQWSGFSVQELLATLSKTMPADNPGKLTPEVNADILAYVLQVNKAPAGPAELKPDEAVLKGIAITASAAP